MCRKSIIFYICFILLKTNLQYSIKYILILLGKVISLIRTGFHVYNLIVSEKELCDSILLRGCLMYGEIDSQSSE